MNSETKTKIDIFLQLYISFIFLFFTFFIAYIIGMEIKELGRDPSLEIIANLIILSGLLLSCVLRVNQDVRKVFN